MILTSIQHGWRHAETLSFGPTQPGPEWVPFTYTVNRQWHPLWDQRWLPTLPGLYASELYNGDRIEWAHTETIT